MNKKLLCIIILIIMMTTLLSCSKLTIKSGNDLIAKPKVGNILYGVWKVKSAEVIDEKLAGTNVINNKDNVSISFSDSMAVIGDNILMDPNIKLKVYYSSHGLLYQYNVDVMKLGIDHSKPIQSILVYQNNSVFCEAIIKNDEEMYIYQNGILYNVYKISNMDDKLQVVKDNNKSSNESKKENTKLYSLDSPTGVLLGLKGSRTKGENGALEQNYRTLWISFKDGSINPILSKEDIFIPRLKGFSLVSVNQNKNDNGDIREYMTVSNINSSLDKEVGYTIVDNNTHDQNDDEYYSFNGSNKKKLIDLLFLSNDYFSVEYTEEYDLNDEQQNYSILRTLPIDNPNNSIGLSIDSLGNTAVDGYNKSLESLSNRDSKQYISDLQSFGMMRQNGYWAIKARANDGKDYVEFDLNCLPTKDMISYDKLFIPWSSIKEVVPNALDAITSPTGRIAIIKTYNELLIYEIENKSLNSQPIGRIGLSNGESIIMAEWANNEFVDSWEKAFKAYGGYEEITKKEKID